MWKRSSRICKTTVEGRKNDFGRLARTIDMFFEVREIGESENRMSMSGDRTFHSDREHRPGRYNLIFVEHVVCVVECVVSGSVQDPVLR